MSKARKLGRGLEALLGEDAGTDRTEEVSIDAISPNPDQPRRAFDEDALQELARSIRAHGVVQPVIVRKNKQGTYDLIAGERRLRAARIAGLQTLPVLVRDYSDRTASEIALIENLQREDLNPVEEGEAYRRLMDTYGYTQDKVAEIVGKSRPYVANMLRLMALPGAVKEALAGGTLSAGQVRPLLALSEEEQVRLSRRIVGEKLSAREVEELVRRMKEPRPAAARKADPAAAHFQKIENELRLSLGTKVHIKNGKGRNRHRGSISISYGNEEEFQRIIAFLKNEE